MKKALCIIGVGLVAGAAAIFLLLNKKKDSDESCDFQEVDEKDSVDEEDSLTPAGTAYQNFIYADEKSSAIGTIYERHKSAAETMKKSVETIQENIKVSDGLNNDINQVSAELDRMSSED